MGVENNHTSHAGNGVVDGVIPRHVLLMPPGQGTQVMISRAPFTQVAFDELHLRRKGEDEGISRLQKFKDGCFCSKKKAWKFISGYLPFIKVIRYYKLKEFAITDIFAGITVGTIHLPQALAFGLLASAKVENGMFASFWPSLVYVFFGTSAHISMGTSAVICILTASTLDREGKAWAEKHPNVSDQVGENKTYATLDEVPEYLDFKEEIAMGLSLIIGVILIVMGFLRLGFITSYLPDSFFAAFTSAAAVHIGTSQLVPMLGIPAKKVPRFPGAFKLIYTYEAIFKALDSARFAAIIMAIICCVIIWFVTDCINQKYKHKLFAPIPIELFIVIFGTIASYFGNFRTEFTIPVVGVIPTGIPPPKVPMVGLEYVSNYIVDAIVIAILTFAYTIAIAKICAKKHNYEVDDSQEMISYGLCNFVCSFLKCIPSCVSPPRAMVASSMNARTTLNGLFSCLLMLLVIMIVASLFKELPKAVLGAIIFIALKNLFIQIKDCYKYWRINKFDCFIWTCTFFCTVFIDIDIGLYVGVGVSALTVVFQTQFVRGYRLGYTKADPALVEHKKYRDSCEIPGVKVFRFKSNLYYANAEIFRSSLYRKTVNPRKLLKGLKKREKRLEKINQERIAQGLPPQEDNNFIMTGRTEKAGNHISDLTTLPPPPADLDYPLSILKQRNGNGGLTYQSSPELSSLDSDAENKNDLSDITHKPGTNGLRKVQLISPDKGLFTIESKSSINTIPEDSGVTKRYLSNLDKLKNSESVVSLYSINFDDYQEDPEDGDEMFTDEKLAQMRKTHHIVVDCAPINYIDASGTNVLTHIYTEYNHVNIKLYLAGCSAAIRSTMKNAGVFDKIPESHFFLDVHDAVSYARPQRPLPITPENIRDFSDEEAIESNRAVNI